MDPTIIIAVISLIGVLAQAIYNYIAKSKDAEARSQETEVNLKKVVDEAVAEQFQRLEDEIGDLRTRIKALEDANRSLEVDKRQLQQLIASLEAERAAMLLHFQANGLSWPPGSNDSNRLVTNDPRLRTPGE